VTGKSSLETGGRWEHQSIESRDFRPWVGGFGQQTGWLIIADNMWLNHVRSHVHHVMFHKRIEKMNFWKNKILFSTRFSHENKSSVRPSINGYKVPFSPSFSVEATNWHMLGGLTSSNYPPFTNSWNPTHYIHKSFSGELNDDSGEIEDDDTLDVVDIISQIYWKTNPSENPLDSFLSSDDICIMGYILYMCSRED
jgi:hypothetical protein